MFFDLTLGHDPLREGPVVLGRAVRLRARRAGRLRVAGGRVWLTRDGHADDLVLSVGDQIRIAAGEAFLAEPWDAGTTARLAWRDDQPVRRGAGLRFALARALRAGARRAEVLAARLSAWARNAEASASRAHGNMACGESMASSGALQ
jgi:Protein of unknown function (DUF2917)